MEGRSLFDLSQLLEYCSGDYSPDITLKRISDKHIRVCGVGGVRVVCLLTICV